MERRRIVDDHRLAYVSEAPVNWCPGLGTVLANEEVTADGRSERGNFPVFKRNLKQWMMRITAYGDRLLDDLDTLDWPEPVKLMQRNWIGRSTGAHIDFPFGGRRGKAARREPIRVFTTRPDTVFGATYMVLAPEHELVDALVAGRLAGRDAAGLDRRARRRRPRRWRRTGRSPPAKTEVERTGRGQGEDRRLHRRLRHQPGQRRADPDLHRRLRAGRLRHRRDHGGARPGRAGLGVRRGLRPADRADRAADRRTSTARRTWATARPSTRRTRTS